MNWHQRLAEDMKQAESNHLLRRRQVVESPQASSICIGGDQLINFCSNDYLGFANHPKLIEASINAAKTWGVGSGASHLVCGHQQIAEQFENDFANFVGAESALLFSTGYMANFAVLNAFFDREGLILQDKYNHASLIDGARLNRAKFLRYAHSDINGLTRQLCAAEGKPTLIASDAVFSMDGDLAAISEIDELSQSADALAYFDDAHGFGVLGNQGRGSLDSLGLSPSGNRIMLATLGKALGSFGAIVAADKIFIDKLMQSARPYIYTTALPPTSIAAASAGLDLMREEDWRFDHLRELIQYFRSGAESLGLKLMPSSTAIQPLVIGDNQSALRCSEILREAGLLVTAIRPPTVPEATARLRITLSAAHSKEHINRLLETLASLQKKALI